VVSGCTLDSRAVIPGDLYAALPGARAHGADFAGQAAGRGAAAVLTDPAGQARAAVTGLPVVVADDARAVLGATAARVHGSPAEDLLVLGVTGTNGKTTTAFLLDAGLRAALSGAAVPTRLVLDLTALEFADVAGIGVLLRHERALASAGGTLELREPSAMVRRMVAVLDLGDRLRLPG